MADKKVINLDNAIKDLEIGVVSKTPPPKPVDHNKDDDFDNDAPPSTLNFRLQKLQRKPLFQGNPSTIAMGVFAALLSVVLLFKFATPVREGSLSVVKDLIQKTKEKNMTRVTPMLVKISKLIRSQRPPQTLMAAAATTDLTGTCSIFIKDAINKKLKSELSEEEFVHLLNCELFQDSPKFVIQSLSRRKIDFNEALSWEKMPMSLLALEATRRMNPFGSLPNFAKKNCLRWVSSPDCLMRFVDEARAPFKSRWIDGYKVLEADVEKSSPSVRAWFHLAGSLYASKENDYVKSDSELQAAFTDIKAEADPYLEREIYRNAVLNAYFSKSASLAKKSLAMKPTLRIEEAPNAFLDVQLIQDLATPKAKEALEMYLSQSESVQRFNSDPRFLTLILGLVQIHQLQDRGIVFAEQLFGRPDEVMGEKIGESMGLLYARSWMGIHKYPEALTLLVNLQKLGFNSPELLHLKGLSQLLQARKKEQTMLAAKDFQSAGAKSKNEDSMFALIVALLDAKDQGKAEQVLAQWKALGPQFRKTMWFGFAEGLVSYTGGNKVEAKAAWDACEKAFPKSSIWPKIKTNLSEDVGYLDSELARRLLLMMPNESPLGSLALFGQKS